MPEIKVHESFLFPNEGILRSLCYFREIETDKRFSFKFHLMLG